jgi:vancomycin resistance protein YoaR
MSKVRGTRSVQHGAVLLGLAGGMLVVAGGLVGGYFIMNKNAVARAAAPAPEVPQKDTKQVPVAAPVKNFEELLAREVDVKTATGSVRLKWSELGVELDPDELKRTSGAADALAKTGSLPVRVDREKAVKSLTALKAKTDRAPINAHLDLEAKVINDDSPGQGLDVWGSIPRISTAARQNAATLELATIAMPAAVTKQSIGIDDISNVLGHYETKFPVTDRDRNFNLKLAASKLNGVVLKPNEEWSFNGTVGERSQRMGYKVAHVITAGEMVDGLAGGTCQISTTLFGASFFAGIEIVKTTNHSRPSAYTPLGFDATVVWPDTDLKLKNPYEFPVVVRYVVANGEAKVEILGKKRPFDKVVFERKIIEESPFSTEERLDEEMPVDQTSIDQEGFNGFKIERFRKFYKDGKVVKSNKWTVNYKPVTEYIRRGTNQDPNAKMPDVKPSHGPKPPKSDSFSMAQ